MWESNDIKKVLYSEEQIQNCAKKLGAKITRDYGKEGKTPLLVVLLKGSIPFMAELIKHIDLDIQFDFMDVTSYEGTESTGEIRIIKDLNTAVKGQDVLIVEDIIDTGNTIATVAGLMKNRGAASVKIVTLLNKQSRRETNVKGDYVGFEIENEFVVGYGLDFNQHYRGLPYIGVLKDELYK